MINPLIALLYIEKIQLNQMLGYVVGLRCKK